VLGLEHVGGDRRERQLQPIAQMPLDRVAVILDRLRFEILTRFDVFLERAAQRPRRGRPAYSFRVFRVTHVVEEVAGLVARFREIDLGDAANGDAAGSTVRQRALHDVALRARDAADQQPEALQFRVPDELLLAALVRCLDAVDSGFGELDGGQGANLPNKEKPGSFDPDTVLYDPHLISVSKPYLQDFASLLRLSCRGNKVALCHRHLTNHQLQAKQNSCTDVFPSSFKTGISELFESASLRRF
jgi:hypothetical protein